MKLRFKDIQLVFCPHSLGKLAYFNEIQLQPPLGIITIASFLKKQNPEIEIEVIDPKTLCPLDKKTIIDSVRKTGKLITVDEGNKTNGFGSEIAAIVSEEAIEY